MHVKLYGSEISPYVRHCRIALTQCNFDWEFVTDDLAERIKKSPVRKIPFLTDGERMLSDSCSILKYAREKAGQEFFPDVDDYDLFCTANTVLDSIINLYLMEKDGFAPGDSRYLARQARRIQSGLSALNGRVGSGDHVLSDGILRTACFLDWALFRNRIDMTPHPNLGSVLEFANKDPVFASTAIPQVPG